jgi:hypothetical protein
MQQWPLLVAGQGKKSSRSVAGLNFIFFLIIISNSLGYQKLKGHLATKVDSKLKYYNVHRHYSKWSFDFMVT